jgi:hypothetical protein
MVSSGWYDAAMTIIAKVAQAVQILTPNSTNPV